MGEESLAAIHRCERQHAEKNGRCVGHGAHIRQPPTRPLPEGFDDIMLINRMMTRPMKNADG
jgi:hypothetical protein